MKVLIQKSMKITLLAVLFTSLFVLKINLVNRLLLFRGENAAYEFFKEILEEYQHCKKVVKKHFDKNLIMREEK